MAKSNKRRRPRSISNDERDDGFESEPTITKPVVWLWALGKGVFMGLLGFILGASVDIGTATKLAIIGFVIGAIAGAVSASGATWPRNKDMTDYGDNIPGWGPLGKHYDNPLMEMMAEAEYKSKSRKHDDEEEDYDD